MHGSRQKLHVLLGSFPACRFTVLERTPAGELLKMQKEMRVEQLTLQTPEGEKLRAILTGPEGIWQGLPAVLYCHAHGNRYEMGANELVEGRPSLLSGPYAPAFAREGIVALSIDMPCFGHRSHQSESAMSKKHLYRGQTLFGQMLSELGGALAFLSRLEGIDRSRIGAFGFSMGATQAFWLGALEPDLRAIAHSCAFADLESLAHNGTHDLHGLYMIVPGLLEHFRTGEIAGSFAPRPQLVQLGLRDPLTPLTAVKPAVEALRAAYHSARAAQALDIRIEADTGHLETAAMRENVLAFFKRYL
jgi:dienelactone hydrolase